MLPYEVLQQLSREHRRQREREARAERLALEARSGRQPRRRRLALAGLQLLPGARERAAQEQRAGA